MSLSISCTLVLVYDICCSSIEFFYSFPLAVRFGCIEHVSRPIFYTTFIIGCRDLCIDWDMRWGGWAAKRGSEENLSESKLTTNITSFSFINEYKSTLTYICRHI